MRRDYLLFTIILILAGATTAGAISIYPTPYYATTATPVSVTAEEWFSDGGQSLVSATYTRNGYNIDMDVVMRDLHGSGVVFPMWVVEEGGTVGLGLLQAGRYYVHADIFLKPWGSIQQNLYSTGNSYFDVAAVPEPSGLAGLLGGLGSLGYLLRRRRH